MKKTLQDTGLIDTNEVTALTQMANMGIQCSEIAQKAMDGAREMRMRSGGDPERFDLALEAGDLADTAREFVRAAHKLRNVMRVHFGDNGAVIASFNYSDGG